MFDHSIKVPRLYKTASKLAKDVAEGKGSIKNLVYECKHPNLKALYALVVHVFQHTEQIENVLKKSKLLAKEPRFDPWLAKILITELLWGKKRLSGMSKPVQTILGYEQILKAHLSDMNYIEDRPEIVSKPRYVRINTLKISINDAIDNFRDEGWILRRNVATTYRDFLQAVKDINQEEFMVDFHIPYLLIFPPKTQFYQHEAYKKGAIILQDKASCLPAHILNPAPDSTILDMCAAPGMKTTQCAQMLNNSGKIYAVEIAKSRFHTLNKIVETSGATCVNAVNTDVLKLIDADCPNIQYILVDPSCSGSGIIDRVELAQQENLEHEYRLEKLAGFQIKMLRHALTRFPSARRVVYSTCSVYCEENEDVVRQVLETCTEFKLVKAADFVEGQWSNLGSGEFGEIGASCLYTKPDVDLTNGFFLAVFERLEDGEKNQFLNKRIFSLQKKQAKERKRKENFQANEETNQEHEMAESNCSNSIKQTKKRQQQNIESVKIKQEDNESPKPKKTKKKLEQYDIEIMQTDSESRNVEKKKKNNKYKEEMPPASLSQNVEKRKKKEKEKGSVKR